MISNRLFSSAAYTAKKGGMQMKNAEQNFPVKERKRNGLFRHAWKGPISIGKQYLMAYFRKNIPLVFEERSV
ncbi:MAG: hypothetical protein ACOYOS_16470 [Syntrophales bacterium]